VSRVVLAAAAASTTLTACTGGVNAGEEGGIAFILLTVVLVLGCAILWFILGRED
jgi:hypothetical protein